jgi:hypothetical protein
VKELQRAARERCWICDEIWKALLRCYWKHYYYLSSLPEDVRIENMVTDIMRATHGLTSDSEDPTAFTTYQLISPIDPTSSTTDLTLILSIDKNAYDTGCNGEPSPAENLYVSLAVSPWYKISSLVPYHSVDDRNDPTWQLNLAKSWVEDCVKNHPWCSNPGGRMSFPTRLLEIGSPHMDHVRLRMCRETPCNSAYVTLSHCWGKAKFLTLTAETLQQLCGGIPVSTLPRTFQDAIQVATWLGVKFLWIDSLCILQDSVEDWRKESLIMGQIYKGGICNIAATGSKDGHGGLFNGRIPDLTSPCFVVSNWEDAFNTKFHVYNRYLDNHGLLAGPLLQRGWVVQERILAPRVLHFGSRQLYWECSKNDACETYTDGVLPQIWPARPGLARFKSSNTWIVKANHEAEDKSTEQLVKDASDYWRMTVTAYSECDLTRAEDKLIALSGVAKALEPFFKCRYLAGIWERELGPRLLWSVGDASQNLGRHSTRPTEYRAPSWSWASVDGPILMPVDIDRGSMQVEIVEVEIEPLGNDPFEQLRGGFIRLRGHISTSRSRKTLTGTQFYINREWDNDASFYCPDVDEQCEKLHCMPISHHEGFYSCLLLQPTGQTKGQFKRHGTVNIYLNNGGGPWEYIRNEEWLEYESLDGINIYTVTVV